MTECARCVELAAPAARPGNAVSVPCAQCGVPGWYVNPTPGFPYAGCIACYRALREDTTGPRRLRTGST